MASQERRFVLCWIFSNVHSAFSTKRPVKSRDYSWHSDCASQLPAEVNHEEAHKRNGSDWVDFALGNRHSDSDSIAVVLGARVYLDKRREVAMTNRVKASIVGLLLFGATGCGTLTGATLGGAAGAGIGAATDSNIGRSAAIGAGVGGAAGAVYDLYGFSRRDRDPFYD